MYFIKLNKIIKVTKKQIQDQEPLKRFHSNFHTIGICPEIGFAPLTDRIILTDCFVCTLNYSEDLYRPVPLSNNLWDQKVTICKTATVDIKPLHSRVGLIAFVIRRPALNIVSVCGCKWNTKAGWADPEFLLVE